MMYDYGALEMWAASSPAANAATQSNSPEDATSETQIQPESRMGVVTLGVVVSLLLVGIGAFAWGSTRVMEGNLSIDNSATPMQVASRTH